MSEQDYLNPFYKNYVFNAADLHRAKIRWWAHPEIWFRPTYIQDNDGYLFHLKTTADGRIFLMKIEEDRCLNPKQKD